MINTNIRATPGPASGFPANGNQNVSAAMTAAAKQSAESMSKAGTVSVAQTYDNSADEESAKKKKQVQNDFTRLDSQTSDLLTNSGDLVRSVNNKLASSTHPRKKEALEKAQSAEKLAEAARTAINDLRAAVSAGSATPDDIKKAQTAYDAAISSFKEADALATTARVNENFINRLFNRMVNAKFQDNDGNMVGFEEHLNNTIDELGTGDSSSPQKLARYQKAIMQFTVHTNATSSMVKSISDLDKGVIRDFN